MSDSADEKRDLWIPDDRGRFSFGDPVDEIVQAYLLYLEVCHPDHHRAFSQRLRSDSDSAKAEAVVFSWLRHERFRPIVAEIVGTGGPDFLCTPDFSDPFLAEVTTLDKDAVALRSGWPDELSDTVRSFGMVTPNLWSKTRAKAPQLGAKEVARVLIICLMHSGAAALLGTMAAKWLMTSEPKISIPIHTGAETESASISQVTDLRNAAFFRIENGQVVPVRQSISAILLVAIWSTQLEVVGLLHPVPAVLFDYRAFDDIPFLRAAWPIQDGRVHIEWVMGEPKPGKAYHAKVVLTEAELRGDLNGLTAEWSRRACHLCNPVAEARGSFANVDMVVTCQVSKPSRPHRCELVLSFLSPRSSIVPAARCFSDG